VAGPIEQDSEPDRSTNMDRYTVHESKRTTATHGRSVWSGLATSARAFALHDGRNSAPHSPSSMADSLAPLSGCVGLRAHSHPRGGASAGFKRTSSRWSTSPRRSQSDGRGHRPTPRSSGILSHGYPAGGRASADCREFARSHRGGKTCQTGQINSSGRHPSQGSRGRLPALLSTSRSQS